MMSRGLKWCIAAVAVVAAAAGCISYGLRPRGLLPVGFEQNVSLKPGGRIEALLEENSSRIDYRIDGLSPYDFYELSVEIDLSATAVQNRDQPAVRLTVSRDQDYNGEAVAGELTLSEYLESGRKNCAVNRIAKADANGCIRFSVQIGSDENEASGSAEIQRVSCVPADADHGYALLQSKDATVRFLLWEEACDGMDMSSAGAFLDLLAEIRAKLGELTGIRDPYPGSTDFVAIDDLAYYGLAGNPIYIHSEYAVRDINESSRIQGEQSGAVLWPYVHEMSHTFDGIDSKVLDGRWNFDREFFADLKMVLVLNEFGLTTRENDLRAQDRFAVMDTLPNGVYSSEGFVYSLVTALEEYDHQAFDHMASVFRMFGSLECVSDVPREKYSLYMQFLSEELGVELQMLFPPRVYETLNAHFQ